MADSAVTPFVFLDTEVFKRHQLDFQSPNIRRLRRLAVEGPVRLLLTTVTKGEILEDLKERAREALKRLKEVRRLSTTMRKILPEDAVKAIEDARRDQAALALQKEFDDFIAEADVMVLDLGSVSVDEIFKKYFEGIPPFGGQGDNRKVEFPDAFAFGALEAWSATNDNAKIYVVGNDGDWKLMCSGHASLISVARIDELLEHFTDTEIGLAIKAGLKDQREELLKVLLAKAPSIDIYLSGDILIDGEIDDYDFSDVDIVEFNVVEISDGHASVGVLCEMSISAHVVADDPDSGIRDPDTREIHYMYRIAGRVSRTVEMMAEVRVSYNKERLGEVTIETVDFEDSSVELFVEEDELERIDDNDYYYDDDMRQLALEYKQHLMENMEYPEYE